mmetsp:Transcript_8112/g.14377  ORF Transcript_8112/g.14377 Transcript_8112/m.14377 type:complete len:592 (+) Transcript_8112:280-2055(+)
MCLECRVLGALATPLTRVNEGEAPWFAGLDFSPTALEVDDKNLRDGAAELYLESTLSRLYENFGIELVPVVVDSDGSCLPHAVSRCLIGKEILFDELRVMLHHELLRNKEWYAGLLRQGMNEETFDSYWGSLCEEAKPTHGELTKRWLGPEHILGLAHVLRRPILLLDQEENMQRSDERSGMFLPLRYSTVDWTSNCPIVLGWASVEHNHFIALVAPSRSALIVSEDQQLADRVVRANLKLWEFIEELISSRLRELHATDKTTFYVPEGATGGDFCVFTDTTTGVEHTHRIPEGLGPGDSFEWAKPCKAQRILERLKRALVHFYGENPPVIRQRASKTIHKILVNLVDALVLGDLSRIEKVRALPLDNKMIRENIIRVAAAKDIFESLEFSTWENDKNRKFLRFAGDVAQPDVCDGLVVARDIISLMSADDSVSAGAGQVPISEQTSVFGTSPAYLKEWPALPGVDHWLFGQGNIDRMEHHAQTKRNISILKESFSRLAQGTDFAQMPWDDARKYHRALSERKCPRCAHVEEDETATTCNDCNQALRPEDSGERRLTRFVASLFEQDLITSCPSNVHVILKETTTTCCSSD